RRDDEAVRVDHAVRVRVEVGPERSNHAVVDADVDRRVDSLRGIEHARAANDEVLARAFPDEQHRRHHATSTGSPTGTGAAAPTSRSYRTAMRVTSPARTCVSISASAWSATRGSISTPRFIGPGCMTFCPGRSRSGVTPHLDAYSRSDG